MRVRYLLMSRLVVVLSRLIFSDEDLRVAYLRARGSGHHLQGLQQHLAYVIALVLLKLGFRQRLMRMFRKEIGRRTYQRPEIDARLLGVYWKHPIVVDPARPEAVNVLIPGFDTKTMSAGFFGVFQVALFLHRQGLRVRLVLFDEFDYRLREAKRSMRDYPGLEEVLDLETVYIGDRRTPLHVSPTDTSVATVWYSAYLARSIAEATGSGRRFLYLIQDYETRFFAESSLSSLAEQSYAFDYAALFSTEFLRGYFLKHDIGGINGKQSISFDNASAASLPALDDFRRMNSGKKRRRIVFYSRPMVDRNMFDLAALALTEAFRRGIFDPAEWECFGMGLGNASLKLIGDVRSKALPRMTLREYIAEVPSFDIALTLMASPHPSLIPMDLGGSGAIVVTNTFATKTAESLQALSGNIIPAEPELEALIAALTEARDRASDLEARHRAAAAMTYPKDWAESLTPRHARFVSEALALPDAAEAAAE